MKQLQRISNVLRDLIEIALLVMAIGILAGLLLGENVPFLGSNVVANANRILDTLGDNAIAGIIALIIFAWLYSRHEQRTATPGTTAEKAVTRRVTKKKKAARG